MRLWHEKLIPYLPRQQLLGQHRECAALRGNGWGKKHSVVDYIFSYNPYKLVRYHRKVMQEMYKRGYKNDLAWDTPTYRGKNCDPWSFDSLVNDCCDLYRATIYPEHNGNYLQECLLNLKGQGNRNNIIRILMKYFKQI